MTIAAAFALKVNNYLSRTVALQKNLTYSNDFKVFGTQNNDEIHLKELCWKIKASSKWDKLDLTAHVTRWVHYPECGKKQNKSPLRVHYSLYFTQKTPHMRQHITLGSMLSVFSLSCFNSKANLNYENILSSCHFRTKTIEVQLKQ